NSAWVHHADVLSGTPASLRRRVSILVAAPPYTPTGAGALLSREARTHEPPGALFGGVDGLDHVRRLIRDALPWLAPDARLLVELHAGQYAAAAAHGDEAGYTSRCHDGADGQSAVIELRRD
ncbi:MAG: SAM-dependent methyltransferase, partial [Mycobacteriales bacterium]